MKTAVEFLYEVSKLREIDIYDWQVAQQMEHEQICDAFGKQFIMKLDGKYDWFTGEEYYENKYGQFKIKTNGEDTSANV